MKSLKSMAVLSLATAFFVTATHAQNTIVYSGADRNVLVSPFGWPPLLDLFDDTTDTWDDLQLEAQGSLFDPVTTFYYFNTSTPELGNNVAFAVGDVASNVKRFTYSNTISAAQTFSTGQLDVSRYFADSRFGGVSQSSGEFCNQTGYAGIRLTKGTNVYYGWIHIQVTDYSNEFMNGNLIDWAYNSTPNQPIAAGATNNAPPAPVVTPAMAKQITNTLVLQPIIISTTNIYLSFKLKIEPTVKVKLQATQSLANTNWTDVTAPVVGDGSVKSFTVTFSGYSPQELIRVEIEDALSGN